MDTSTNFSSTSRFRFRDHRPEMDDKSSTESHTHTTSDTSSDGESQLQTMTGKGIKRLCSELLELKKASDEDFQKNIFSNYSAFVRVFEEMDCMENELMQLKHHVSTQKLLVKNLIDDVYVNIPHGETVESVEEPLCAEPPHPSLFECHTNDISENLDTLISERRLDEALVILELEAVNFRSEENISSNVLMSYNSAMSERRSMLTDQLTVVAENPRVSAAELQKALVGLCRLADDHLATQLLLKYYHSRIESGIHEIRFSKTFLYRVYIREVAKFVFSMISQATRSFVVLHGETSPFALELIQWAHEETVVFANCFITHVKSISEISGGLSTAVEAVGHAMSYCSLLENQKIVLQPCLIKCIRPCMEDNLQIHFDHFKKVISIFTSTDAWVLGRYLVSGILSEGSSYMVIGQQPEYCLLTDSGRKFVMLLQGITEDITSLVSLQMESSILKGLMDLLTEYIAILERSIIDKINVVENGGPRINLAESLTQQVSILINTSTLVLFFSSIIINVFKDINHFKFEIDSCILFVEEACSRIRSHFCRKFIDKITSLEGDHRLSGESCIVGQGDSKNFRMPSVPYQGLFSELRKLEKLAEDNFIEEDWLMELLRDLMEAIFVWISNHEEICTITDEDLTDQRPSGFLQFILNVQFMVEIARFGGYLTNKMVIISLDIISRVESGFVSVGLDSNRDATNDYEWAIIAATEALQTLLEIENKKSPSNGADDNLEDTNDYQSDFVIGSPDDDEAISSSKDSFESLEDPVNRDALDDSINEVTKISKVEAVPLKEVEYLVEESGFTIGKGMNSSESEESGSQLDCAELVVYKLEEDSLGTV